MPPPIAEHQKRFTANPARPTRYRPGKGVQEQESSEEEEEEEDEEVQQPKQPQKKPQARPRAPAKPHIDEDEDDDEAGFVTEDDEDADGGASVSVPVSSNVPQTDQPSQRAAHVPTTKPIPKQEDRSSSNEEEESESEDESEEESSSEDEAPRRKFQRPTFIKKTDRKQSANPHADAENGNSAPEISSSHNTDDTAARRLAEAESMIKTTIERDMAARLAGKKSWDDDDDLPLEALVDDTDGLDPEAEHLAWRLRELHRLKRDREAMIAREKELEEIERRRNLTKEERAAEDREFLAKQKEDRDAGRGQAAYLSKYNHKGAFFMDDADSERLAKRDLIGAKFEGDVDKSILPEYMRVRDMTKLGKKGRTRYTDLKGTDTGRFGEDVKRWKGSGYDNNRRDGDDMRGLDERFLPDDDRRRGPTASGANASAVGERRKRSRSRETRDRRGSREGRDSYRPQSRSRSRSKERRRRYSSSRSRSRSSRRSRSGSSPYRSRRRSPSPYHERDKRRRIEA